MSNSKAVEVCGVTKQFRVYHERNNTLKSMIFRRKRSSYEDFLALDDVSLDVFQGETFAIIGDNGSGKSTLLKCMARILTPDKGKINRYGRVAALLEVGSGFHPELSGRDNIYLNGSILGMTKTEIDACFDDIVDFSGIGGFIDEPVKNYSSGMYVRLGFSVAVHVDPEVLLVDEVIAVGDAAFQRKCQTKFEEFKSDGRTVVVVAHSVPTLRRMCDRGVLLDKGKAIALGEANSVLDTYEEKISQQVAKEVHGVERWGSGELSITNVEALDESGKVLPEVTGIQGRSAQINSGQTIRLRMHYEAKGCVIHPQFAFAIDTEEGQRLWGGDTRFEEIEYEEINRPGMIEAAVTLPLREGGYWVHASILDTHTVHNYDYLKNILFIQVDDPQRHAAGGPLWVQERWSIKS